MRAFWMILVVLAFSSCETDHTYRKQLVNNSDLDVLVEYNNSYAPDSIFHVLPGESLVLVDSWKRGNHPESMPTLDCAMMEEDSVSLSLDTAIPYVFIADFRDESRWESEFVPGRSSVHTCTFTILNEDFVQ